MSKPDGSKIIVEKAGRSTVEIDFDVVKSRTKTVMGLQGADALLGYDNLMERSHTGFLITTHLPHGSTMSSYHECQELEEYNTFSHNTVHLLRRYDQSIYLVKQDGEVVIISSNQRSHLNSIGLAMTIPEDKDYFFEIFGVPEKRRAGVYTAELANGRIWTTDDEGNTFVVYANGESVERMAVSFDLSDN